MESQLREHLKFGWSQQARLLREKWRLGHCGEGVYFERNVKLMLYPEKIRIGSGAVVKEGAKICACNPEAEIVVGETTTIGYHTLIFASERIEIGRDCLIAPFVYLVDSNHGMERGERINRQPNQTAPIVVGDDVWIGTGAKILAGVRVGEGAVIAAGALVREDVEPYEIVGGIPARVLGGRQ